MAKKKASKGSDRSDPTKNKSLAIRTVLKNMPTAKVSDVVDTVKSDYGHDVTKNMVYMVKTKVNMASDGRAKGSKAGKGAKGESPLSSAAMWVDAIRLARQLLKAAGSTANAAALLKALGDH